ncbi:PIG-L deacetylase family protein [Cecembia calidifontis]|jgi:LmbE family N-acetylglucosaminyl deacetylase|uniref:LmbE family N-acetylglucosaminyl deacetylase n=1 Tax=Cecembia calidifontis TaxID=1187080 RepID=A0A4Q7PAP6_9BACT|nr:PIG-L family deacetylase [Cecembia calidifontis]RZS97255.1 LmbE family N-acetylglucosaminyl deacetylase [Cecembia calidifontis]
MKHIGIILAVGILVVMVLTAFLMLLGRYMLQDSSIPVKSSLINSQYPKTIMTFFAHPDDEIAVGGTLLQASHAGHKIVLVCLTKGEAGPTGGLVDRKDLAQTRSEELKQVAGILGAEAVEIFDYPDSGLDQVDFKEIKDLALSMVKKYQPDVLITYDSKIGLYGHKDHRTVSKAMEDVYLKHKGSADFSAQQYFQVTLSKKQIEMALKLSSGFKRNYPKEGPGLPVPDFSVRTTSYFPDLLNMIAAHATQHEVLGDFFPYYDKIPAWIYARIFDREYFYEFGVSD